MNPSFSMQPAVRCAGPQRTITNGRRGFLQTGLAGFASLTLPSILRMQAQQKLMAAESVTPASEKTAVIMVWKPGGCSHIDSYDPKPTASIDYRGPFKTIDTNVPGM